MESLWGEMYTFPEKEKTKKIINKASSPKKDPASYIPKTKASAKKLPLKLQMEAIKEEVFRVLGKYAKNITCIRDMDTYMAYIDKCIQNGIIGIDTETDNSLDPFSCKIMGLCLYTPGEKYAYVPVNHIDVDEYEKDNNSWVLVPNQLTEAQLKVGIDKMLEHKVFMDTSNGKFDLKVIHCTCGCDITIDWDTQIAANILDENELAGLKVQYKTHVDSSDEKYDIENLFQHLPYAIFDPEVFAMYAAVDPYKSHKLAEWQRKQFNLPGNEEIKELYLNIEQPLHTIIGQMEIRGVEIDEDFAERLSNKYQKILDKAKELIDTELANLEPRIASWRETPKANERYFKTSWLKKNPDFNVKLYGTQVEENKWKLNSIINMPFKIDDACEKSLNQKLESPANLGSPAQIAILLYDVLNVGVIDKKSPRSTSEDVMEKLQASIPLCKAIQDQKHMKKFLDTYVLKIPKCVDPATNALHCNYHQTGARTGRMSSSDPNLQNIPSIAPEIRLLFKARKGYKLFGSDFSAQEPRITAFISGDRQFLAAYREGKDLYRVLAAQVFHNTYEDNGEFWSDGTPNPEGKHRRKAAKKLLLGLTYGMQIPLIAEEIGCSVNEAKDLYNSFLEGFPDLSGWVEKVKEETKKLGYAKGLMGRRRRLPDIQLPKYEAWYKDPDRNKTTFFNPLLGSSGINESTEGDKILNGYLDRIKNARYWDEASKVMSEAYANGVCIKDNGGDIAAAERQSVNSIIQGSAATMTKLAMILFAQDEWMKEHDCHMLIPVHDELICEGPEEYVEEAADRLTKIMVDAAYRLVGDAVPFKCDPTIMYKWYEDEVTAQFQEYVRDDLIGKGMTNGEAFTKMMELHPEFTEEEMNNFIGEVLK